MVVTGAFAGGVNGPMVSLSNVRRTEDHRRYGLSWLRALAALIAVWAVTCFAIFLALALFSVPFP